MARTDTLPHFLTDVADAIRTKTGSSDTIQASTFDTAIANIPSGGGSIEEKDVNFYDYDGTLLHSYTAQEFAALESMPENPTHEGLTAQGWNWTFQEAQDFVEDYGACDIGQMYTTDNGATRIYVTLRDGRLSPYLGIAVNGSATVDWGDNTTSTVTGTSITRRINTMHTYSQAGDYVISISSQVPIYFYGGSEALYSTIFWANYSYEPSHNDVYRYGVTKIELGNNIVSLDDSSFYGMQNLETITMPATLTTWGPRIIRGCTKLKHITVPRGITSISDYGLSINNNPYSSSFKSISLPKTITNLNANALSNNSELKRIILPKLTSVGSNVLSNSRSLKKIIYDFDEQITVIPTGFVSGSSLLEEINIPNHIAEINGFSSCTNLKSIILPDSLTTINASCFSNCGNLISIVIPATVISIGNQAFDRCVGMVYYDFSNLLQIPTLGTSVFSTMDSSLKIIVPDSLYEDWIVATNWSSYASKIIKKSDWDALQNA